MSERLPCPQSAMEMHRLTFSFLATAIGTLYLLVCPVALISQTNLQLRRAKCCDFCLNFWHWQLCKCESCGGRVHEPSRTVPP